MYRMIFGVLLVCFITGPAAARHRHYHQASVHHYSHHHHRAAAVEALRGFPNLFDAVDPKDAIFKSIPPTTKIVYSRSNDSIDSTGGAVNTVTGHSRPADCYGIAWCGCFLRHYFGLADKSLNLAANWAGIGRASNAHSGVIVVWRHHVGLMRSEPDAYGDAVVLSGNDGRGQVRERSRSIRGAIAFREL